MACTLSHNAWVKYEDLQKSLRAFLKEIDVMDGLTTLSVTLSPPDAQGGVHEHAAHTSATHAKPAILQIPGLEIRKQLPIQEKFQFIHRLPNEILFAILGMSWKPYRHEVDQLRAHQTIELVCHRWMNVIRSAPLLFSRASVHRNSRMLLHSENAPLDIIGPLHNLLFMELIKSSHKRWRSFESNSIHGGDKTAEYLISAAPIIKSFKSKLRNYKAINLFGGYAPQLQYLEIPSMVIRWDTNLLRGLRTLHVTAWDGIEVPSNYKIRQVLVSCPDLQELHLIGKQGLSLSSDITFDDVESVIHLPRLRQLRLLHLPLQTLSYILASIQSPPFEDVHVEITTPSEFALVEALVRLPSDNPLTNASKSGIKTNLLLGGYDEVWIQLHCTNSEHPQTKLRIRGSGGCPMFNPLLLFSNLFSAWIPTIESVQIWEVAASLRFPTNYGLAGHDFLCSLVNVEKVQIRHIESSQYSILAALGTPRQSSPRSWPCPKMTCMRVSGTRWVSVGELLSCIKARYGVKEGVVYGGDSFPVPLEELSVTGSYYPENDAQLALAEIGHVVGNDVFRLA